MVAGTNIDTWPVATRIDHLLLYRKKLPRCDTNNLFNPTETYASIFDKCWYWNLSCSFNINPHRKSLLPCRSPPFLQLQEVKFNFFVLLTLHFLVFFTAEFNSRHPVAFQRERGPALQLALLFLCLGWIIAHWLVNYYTDFFLFLHSWFVPRGHGLPEPGCQPKVQYCVWTCVYVYLHAYLLLSSRYSSKTNNARPLCLVFLYKRYKSEVNVLLSVLYCFWQWMWKDWPLLNQCTGFLVKCLKHGVSGC